MMIHPHRPLNSWNHGTNMSWHSLWASRRDSMSQNQPRGVTTSSVVSRGSLAWIFRTCVSLADKNIQKRNLDSFVSERSGRRSLVINLIGWPCFAAQLWALQFKEQSQFTQNAQQLLTYVNLVKLPGNCALGPPWSQHITTENNAQLLNTDVEQWSIIDDFDKSWFWSSKSVLSDQFEAVLPEPLKLWTLFNMSDLLCLIGSVWRFQQHIIQTNKYEFKISKWHKLITKHNLSKNNAQFALTVTALTVVSGKLEISLSYHFSKLSSDTKVAVTQVTSWHLRKVSQTGVMASLPTSLWHNQNFFEHNVHLYYTLFSMFFSNTAGVRCLVCFKWFSFDGLFVAVLMSFWPRCGTNLDGISERRPRAVATPHAALRRRNLRFTSQI